ncbi:hypothetical protein NDU88_004279 [Pleurodeles waltl]|uniref:Uncharacterized protein n=1 Tax=Pleurodeles waltl TaxID=8319 RepID=A0AAV7RFB3_PLEWA|nr:hypothetical protein NDU88_004279 [Pleurodeles waltl]
MFSVASFWCSPLGPRCPSERTKEDTAGGEFLVFSPWSTMSLGKNKRGYSRSKHFDLLKLRVHPNKKNVRPLAVHKMRTNVATGEKG